jgi:hypothetical protein
MAESRSRIILISVVVADSIWLFALFAVAGVVVDLGSAPLPWLAVFGLLVASVGMGALFGGVTGDTPTLAIWQALIALVAIYLFMGTGSYVQDRAFDAGWIAGFGNGSFRGPDLVSIILAFCIAIWLWRHGLKLATNRFPEDRLSRVFKIGIAVLAVSVLVDQARREDLGASTLLVPFFAATLVGMAVGRLPESGVGQKSVQWARVIGVSVLGVMGAGLLIGLIGGTYGSSGVRLLYAGWGLFVDGIIWLIRYPVTGIAAFIQWIIGLFGNSLPEPEESRTAPQSGQEILGINPERAIEQGDSTVESIIQIIQYPVIALIVVLAFFLLALAFRKYGKRDNGGEDDERDSIRGDADAAGDMARLLGGLVPGWLRGHSKKVWRYPHEQGIAEVFRLYFDVIAVGMKWGVKFEPYMTPVERLPLLQAALPGAPVQEVTERFNAACYGHVPTDPQRVLELEASLREAERLKRHS